MKSQLSGNAETICLLILQLPVKYDWRQKPAHGRKPYRHHLRLSSIGLADTARFHFGGDSGLPRILFVGLGDRHVYAIQFGVKLRHR